ncbi:MAG: hypothetical protein ACPL25_07950, partial [Ignavibacteria bacterium]
FALKPDFDYTFIEFLIEQKKFENAYRIVHLHKIKNVLEYFLRFHDFDFLENNHQVLLQNFKNEILSINTYQQILRQELSLPFSQRIKEKLKAASKICDEKNKRIEEHLKNLSHKYSFLQPIISQTNFENLIQNDSKIFAEIFPTEENLFYFLIGNKGIYAKSLKSDLSSLKFNSKILLKNFDQFTLNEIIEFCKENLSWLIDDILKEIEQKYPATKEIVFLLNGSEFDLIPSLVYSIKLNGFLRDKYFVSYSYLLDVKTGDGLIRNFAVLKNGQLVEIGNRGDQNELIQTQTQKTILKKPEIRIRFRENLTSSKIDSISIKKNFEGIFIFDNLFVNEASPELIYFKSLNERSNKSTISSDRIYLRDIFQRNPELFFLSDFKLDERHSNLKFFSLFEFIKSVQVIFPVNSYGQEISENFLYNYKERVENKNLKEASTILLQLLSRDQKESLKNSLKWISFTN